MRYGCNYTVGVVSGLPSSLLRRLSSSILHFIELITQIRPLNACLCCRDIADIVASYYDQGPLARIRVSPRTSVTVPAR